MKNKIRKKSKSFQYNFFIRNQKGISGVIATVLMIALVMVVVVIVWVVVRNIVQNQIGSVESCFGIYDKVTINDMYTCYNSSLDQFQFSIKVEDIDLDKLIISVSSKGSTNSYILTNDNQDIGLILYSSGEEEVKLPGKYSGLTYIITDISTKPDSIQIAPVVNGQQCEISDSLFEIDDCLLLS